jgi:phage tail-like protein
VALSSDEIKAAYPLPTYNYRVTIGGDDSSVIGFSEVSGLSLEYEPVTYKHGLSFAFGSRIIPGMRQPIQVTLKRGVTRNNRFLYDWIRDTYSDPFSGDRKRDIEIDLCDENGSAVLRWTVRNALPTKLEAPAFEADSNEVAIETLELTAHGLEVGPPD